MYLKKKKFLFVLGVEWTNPDILDNYVSVLVTIFYILLLRKKSERQPNIL